jgi:hypothetical protein
VDESGRQKSTAFLILLSRASNLLLRNSNYRKQSGRFHRHPSDPDRCVKELSNLKEALLRRTFSALPSPPECTGPCNKTPLLRSSTADPRLFRRHAAEGRPSVSWPWAEPSGNPGDTIFKIWSCSEADSFS